MNKPKLLHFLHTEWLQILLVLIPLAAALGALPYATEKVPMQWGMDGRVNWYAPLPWGLLALPLSMMAMTAVLLWLEGRDAGRRREADGALTAHGKATRAIRLAVSGTLALVMLLQVGWALGHRPDTGRWIITAVALLCAFMGNLFGKLKPNRYVGIRVPWTMNSLHVWRQTHRVAGWLWTSSSLIVAALSWLLPAPLMHTHLLGGLWLALLTGVPLLVAWRAARAERL